MPVARQTFSRRDGRPKLHPKPRKLRGPKKIFAMSLRIEDYAMIGNAHTVALVGNNGSIDWLCIPRFDSGACFAALLGNPANGHWQIAPNATVQSVRRRYSGPTLILENEFVTESGAVVVIDFMPVARLAQRTDIVRIVRGLRGAVPMRMDLTVRFDYGHIVPWITRYDHTIRAIAGPDALELKTPVPLHVRNLATVSEFTIASGQSIPFTLTWYPSHDGPPSETTPASCWVRPKHGGWSGHRVARSRDHGATWRCGR